MPLIWQAMIATALRNDAIKAMEALFIPLVIPKKDKANADAGACNWSWALMPIGSVHNAFADPAAAIPQD